MLLQQIMSFWALLILVIIALALGGLLTRRRAGERTQESGKALFDFTAQQTEGRQLQNVLTEALSGTETDAEFERKFRSGANAATGLDAENSWAWLGRLLMEYRRADEFTPSPRTLAQRFLEDIPHRYQLKSEAPEPPTA